MIAASELAGIMDWMPALLTGCLVGFVGLILRTWVRSVDQNLTKITALLEGPTGLVAAGEVTKTTLADHERRLEVLERRRSGPHKQAQA